MCCSSGLCGPAPDQALVELDKAIQETNTAVKRLNLTHNFLAFKQQEDILKTIKEEGSDTLPITTVNNKIVLKGRYPSKQELQQWSGQ